MRVKTGFTRRRAHKKVLQRTKGYRMTKNRLYKVAREADLHAGQYAFAGRKRRKRQFRQLWITRINAGLRPFEISYSVFIKLLKDKKVNLNRKLLADLAVNDQGAFEKIVSLLKG